MNIKVSFVLDCSGHLCPVPILMTEERIKDMQIGDVLEVIFTDPGARADLECWCKATGHECLGFKGEKFKVTATIRKTK
jgi:tRNA 2-thiouridine synthesizing protein A